MQKLLVGEKKLLLNVYLAHNTISSHSMIMTYISMLNSDKIRDGKEMIHKECGIF